MASSSGAPERRSNPLLKSYYGMEVQAENKGPANPFDLNCPDFNPDMFMSKLIRESCLLELMNQEQEMIKDIQALDSDRQTLVYENYNKFISATDTIRKMKNDFKRMEDEMDGLATNMESIMTFSAQISDTLLDRRQQITKLAGVHTLLKKLQFLFELPARLNKCLELEAYVQAVSCYTKAQKVLLHYQDIPSFHGIQEDCNVIIAKIKDKLREQFHTKEATPKQLAQSVDLLLQLGEPADLLCQEFLNHADEKLREDLAVLERQVQLQAGENLVPPVSQFEKPSQAYMELSMDILEFIDLGCNGFLTNICLVIASYNDMFLSRFRQQRIENDGEESMDSIALKKLVNFVMTLMNHYLSTVQQRVQLERETSDNSMLVRALDRFHRRLQAMNNLLPDTDFARTGTDIVCQAGADRCALYLKSLKEHFSECLTDIRQNLLSAKSPSLPDGNNANLTDLLRTAEAYVLEQLRSVLCNLQAFIQSDITFASKSYFRDPFCKTHVREGVVVAFFRHINNVASEFCDTLSDRGSAPAALLLILSRLCLDFETNTINTMLALTDEYFEAEDKIEVTAATVVSAETKELAQKLLNHYVRIQGLIISQMLRKSVETRDWLNTIEPRTVRAVMKRVVEDVTAMDAQVGQLYEEGVRKERSSDSSRRLQSGGGRHVRSNWSTYTSSTIDNSLISNIQKLFSERIEFFSSVQFSKVSVLTGIIKISLKTFLECVRLRTFGRYGLQQIQVDTHYLQLYLWRFVSDENLVHVLLDEILGSTVHRCLDPVLMESSVVEVICERG